MTGIAAGAHTHGKAAATRVVAAARTKTAEEEAQDAAQRAEAELAWREEQKAQIATELALQAAEAEAARHANKAAILEQYAGGDDSAEEENRRAEPEEDTVEDWEIWGDPREVHAASCLNVPERLTPLPFRCTLHASGNRIVIFYFILVGDPPPSSR